jgi:hypothetical protein
MYRSLNAGLIVDTSRATQQRIAERFTNSGLSKVAGEILIVSEQAAALAAWLARPLYWLQVLAALGIAAIFLIIISVAVHLKVQTTVGSLSEFFQGSDAAINEVVCIGVTTFFFLTLETRLKRRRALKAIHELRSLAHIIDMHQLTKDPEHMADTPPGEVRRPQNPAELIRYLDNCSDLLALLSKIAALYIQNFDDPVTLSAVNEIENLTNGISRKIWQKIMILDRILTPAGGTDADKANRQN